eukprot:scaffold239310_cov19-Tisochrysis_lutea.AAC.1
MDCFGINNSGIRQPPGGIRSLKAAAALDRAQLLLQMITDPSFPYSVLGLCISNALCWVDYLDHNVEGKAWEGAQWDVINYAYGSNADLRGVWRSRIWLFSKGWSGGSTACGPSALYVGTPPLAAQVRGNSIAPQNV